MQEHHRKQFQQQNRFLLRLLNPKATPDNSPSERQCLELRWSRARSARRSSLGRGDRIVVVVEADLGYSERTTVGAGGEWCGVHAHVDADPPPPPNLDSWGLLMRVWDLDSWGLLIAPACICSTWSSCARSGERPRCPASIRHHRVAWVYR
jgi:hypothetical protein